MAGEFITIARVLGPQGRRGEVLAELHTDFPERFDERRKLWLLAKDESRREMELEEHWFHKAGVVLKFAGVDSISDAERLSGCEVQLPREDRAELEPGSAYVSEIAGCEVWIDGGRQHLGRVKEVQFGAGEAPLLVVQLPAMALPVPGRDKEVLVPFAEEFVERFDPAGRRIEMNLPEGLLNLDAPLSDEEKQRQKREADEAKAAGEVRERRRRDRG